MMMETPAITKTTTTSINDVDAHDHDDSDDDIYMMKMVQSKRIMLKTEVGRKKQDESMFLTLGLVTMMTLLTCNYSICTKAHLY